MKLKNKFVKAILLVCLCGAGLPAFAMESLPITGRYLSLGRNVPVSVRILDPVDEVEKDVSFLDSFKKARKEIMSAEEEEKGREKRESSMKTTFKNLITWYFRRCMDDKFVSNLYKGKDLDLAEINFEDVCSVLNLGHVYNKYLGVPSLKKSDSKSIERALDYLYEKYVKYCGVYEKHLEYKNYQYKNHNLDSVSEAYIISNDQSFQIFVSPQYLVNKVLKEKGIELLPHEFGNLTFVVRQNGSDVAALTTGRDFDQNNCYFNHFDDFVVEGDVKYLDKNKGYYIKVYKGDQKDSNYLCALTAKVSDVQPTVFNDKLDEITRQFAHTDYFDPIFSFLLYYLYALDYYKFNDEKWEKVEQLKFLAEHIKRDNIDCIRYKDKFLRYHKNYKESNKKEKSKV